MALDLEEDESLIAEYVAYHREIWPEIKQSILGADVEQMEIYRFGHRLMMIMEVNDRFTFERKGKLDAENPKVQEWEKLMWKYQKALPGAKEGEKWVIMDRIFQLV